MSFCQWHFCEWEQELLIFVDKNENKKDNYLQNEKRIKTTTIIENTIKNKPKIISEWKSQCNLAASKLHSSQFCPLPSTPSSSAPLHSSIEYWFMKYATHQLSMRCRMSDRYPLTLSEFAARWVTVYQTRYVASHHDANCQSHKRASRLSILMH